MNWLTKYLDSNPRLRPYYLMWLRGTTKTINKWPKDKFIEGVMDCFERHCGYRFDLNNPVTFNEKLQWYKVYYRHPDFERITDKVTFKDYIRERLGEGNTIPMFGYWTKVSDVLRDWGKLPNEFVLKSNMMANASGVIVIRDKSKVDLKELKKKLRMWLNPIYTLNNSWDCHFYSGTPKVLAEEFMQDEYGELRDYKFFCFDGKAPYFRVDYGREKQHHATFFDSDLNELDISVPSFPKEEGVKIDLPKDIDQRVGMAKTLSKGFPFVRVDFFYCNGKPYLAEMTFAPGGGVSPYPEEFGRKLGEMLKLPIQAH